MYYQLHPQAYPQAHPHAYPQALPFSTGLQPFSPPGTQQYTPRVDILETALELIFLFEMPGVEHNTVNVEIKENFLSVEGNINMEALELQNEEYRYLYRERDNRSSYSRLLSVPPEVDHEQAAASVKNGLLMVRFPRKTTGRRLSVNPQQQPAAPQQQPPQQFAPNPNPMPGH